MANWAIVIGIDEYWKPQACLRGAVNDALKVRTWLLDPQGGKVPAENLTLLLAPDLSQPPADVPWTSATSDDIVLAIEKLLRESRGQGERFYLYFAGHGLTARINASNQSGIVATDFTEELTDKTLTLWSLFELFQATQFERQFFFVDACRNMPFDTEKRLRDYPNPRKPTPPVSPQLIMYATQPGLKAAEIREPGNERGAFTDALLAGLKGRANAKRWDDRSDQYLVRWNSLFEYVEADVTQRQFVAAKLPNGPLIQVPRQHGERGTDNPDLGSFAAAQFAQGENLDVDLVPGAVQAIANVAINSLEGTVDRRAPPIAALPLRFTLPPRTYGVTASAPGWVNRRRSTPVDLYRAESIRIELDPAPPTPADQPGAGPVSPDGREIVFRSLGDLAEPSFTSLEVACEDHLAEIEVADASGGIIRHGRRSVVVDQPGIYRARAVTPEGDAMEQLVQATQGVSERVVLRAPQRLSQLVEDIGSRLGFRTSPDDAMSPSEAVGPAAGLRLSTLLALAAAATTEADSPYGQRLRKLGVPGFGPPSGVQVVFGDESPNPVAWHDLALQLWPVGTARPVEAVRPDVIPQWPQLFSASLFRPPGSYTLSVGLPGRPTLLLPLCVLPGRVSLIVVTRRSAQQLDLHQYMLLLPSAMPAMDPYVVARMRDPDFGMARFAAIRRIEWMQRCASSGRITPTKPDIDLLLWDKWQDPIAGCLGGYLMLRMEGPNGPALDEATRNLVKYFGELPDSHVLRGAVLEAKRPPEARAAYAAALERGLPMFRDGLALLAAGTERLPLTDRAKGALTQQLAHVPAGGLWSAVPDAPAFQVAVATESAPSLSR